MQFGGARGEGGRWGFYFHLNKERKADLPERERERDRGREGGRGLAYTIIKKRHRGGVPVLVNLDVA